MFDTPQQAAEKAARMHNQTELWDILALQVLARLALAGALTRHDLYGGGGDTFFLLLSETSDTLRRLLDCAEPQIREAFFDHHLSIDRQ